MNARSLVALATAAAAAACTTPPERFSSQPQIVDGCAYAVEPTPDGFALEVMLKHPSFLPDADAAVQAGRACFRATAAELAKRASRSLAPITVGDMSTNAARNILSGAYTVHVTGKVATLP